MDPVATRDFIIDHFGSDQKMQQFMNQIREEVTPLVRPNTLIITCGAAEAVGFAKMQDPKLDCVILTDIIMPLSDNWVLQYGGCLSREAAKALREFANMDQNADEAILAPPEFCGVDYDNYFASGGVRTMALAGLLYEPLNEFASDPRHNPKLRELLKAAGSDPVAFVFGGGGSLWLPLYRELGILLQKQNPRPNYAVLVPTVEEKNGKLDRVEMSPGCFEYTLFKCDGSQVYLPDPGLLAFWYAGIFLVVGRGGLVAQQVLATMLADNPPQRPFMLFLEELGHPQIEHERLALQRLGFVTSSTLERFRKDPLGAIQQAVDAKTVEATEIMRLRVRARYGTQSLDNAIKMILKKYLK